MKIILIAIFALIGYYSYKSRSDAAVQTGWSVAYEKGIRDTLKKSLDGGNISAEQKTWAINCVISELKDKHPYGLPKVSKDSLYRIFYSAGVACGSMMPVGKFDWSTSKLALIRKELLASPQLKYIPMDKREAFCDCYISELLKSYPDGTVGKINTDTNLVNSTWCLAKIGISR